MMKTGKQLSIQAHYDCAADTPEDIEAYMHCVKCMQEWEESFQGVMSPRQYARTQVGIRKDGSLQVVCTRHDCNVAVITFSLKDE